MIILEGPDGAGKSTLAQQLSADLNVPLHHSGGPPRDRQEIIARQARMNKDLLAGVVKVYDRAPCISDPIYGPIIRGETPFDDYTHLALEFRMRLKVPVIYCRPRLAFIHAALVDRLEPEKTYKPQKHIDGVRKNVDAIVASYDWNIGHFPHWRYDWTGQTESPTYAQLIGAIRELLVLPELVM